MTPQPNPYAPPKAPVHAPKARHPVEDGLNWFSDQDWGWWPVVRLRPARDNPMTAWLLVKLALLALVPVTLFMYALFVRRGLSIHHAAVVAVVSDVAGFAFYRATFVVAWNRRARRLRDAPASADAAPLDRR